MAIYAQERWVKGKTVSRLVMSEPIQRREHQPSSKEREIEFIEFTDGSQLRFVSIEQDYEGGYIQPLYIPPPANGKRRKAAPELLEACRKLLSAIEELDSLDPGAFPFDREKRIARAAIAKATGKAVAK